ncbi:MAG TPA: hypothetical protein VNW46_09200 [Gemmatimonadaceae bacterium]|jgi:hypothetical protein|nr:hypothetical protein [Gemmatimonadaceae bacterium]
MVTGSAERPASPAGKSTDEIAALLQERRRFEQWLATLESRRAITPPNVYGRVHADYTARLSAVLDELGGRSAELQQSVESLTGRVAALQSEESMRRDERYEAELRAAVGEFTQERWLQLSEASDAELARLGQQRTELTAELAQMQQLLVLAKARREPTAAAPAPPPPTLSVPAAAPASIPAAPAAKVPPPLPPKAAPPLAPMAPATLPSAAPAASAPLGIGEFADIASVTPVPGPPVIPPPPPTLPFAAPGGAPRGNAPRPAEPRTADGAVRRPVVAPPAAAPAAPKAEGPAKKGEQSMFDELEFLKSVVDPKAEAKGGTVPAKPAGDVRAKTPPVPAPAQPARRLSTPPEAGTLNDISLNTDRPRARPATDKDGVPVFLRDVPTEQVKTLKCQECGSMNYPTEWYCERCGGELAAM